MSLWTEVISDLNRMGIRYCALRDIPVDGAAETSSADDSRNGSTTRHVEVDVLVDERDLPQLAPILEAHNFIRLRRWGYAPHHFFVAYDENSDLWLKLDIVTRIALGQPAHVYRTKLAESCIEHRVQRGAAFVPAAEEEFITLLLHCVIDKGKITPARRALLQQIAAGPIDETRFTKLVETYWPSGTDWPKLKSMVLGGDWDGLLDQRSDLIRHLIRHDPLRSRVQRIRDRVLRKLSRVRSLFQPDVPTVALLAPDGAGKSTVAQGVAESFFLPARLIYMGMYQKNADGYGSMKIPGIGLGIRMMRQWGRYLRARMYQAGGRLVLFDRYNYDAMLQPDANEGYRKRFRRWLLSHSCPHADIVFMLDAPGESLYARKQEHSAEILEEQRQAYRALHTRLPQMVVVDATRDVNEVRREVLSCIWRGCAKTRR